MNHLEIFRYILELIELFLAQFRYLIQKHYSNKQYSCSAFIIWKAICYFNEQGLDIFDMGGVPVKPTKDHPAYGVYAFKRSFGGEYQEFKAGDIIISSFKYKILEFILSQRKILRFFSTKI